MTDKVKEYNRTKVYKTRNNSLVQNQQDVHLCINKLKFHSKIRTNSYNFLAKLYTDLNHARYRRCCAKIHKFRTSLPG